MNRIDEIKAREAKATEGPWIQWHCRYRHVGIPNGKGIPLKETHSSNCRGVIIGEHGGNHTMRTEADDAFVAHARQDIPYLLHHIEKLEKALKEIVPEREDGKV